MMYLFKEFRPIRWEVTFGGGVPDVYKKPGDARDETRWGRWIHSRGVVLLPIRSSTQLEKTHFNGPKRCFDGDLY